MRWRHIALASSVLALALVSATPSVHGDSPTPTTTPATAVTASATPTAVVPPPPVTIWRKAATAQLHLRSMHSEGTLTETKGSSPGSIMFSGDCGAAGTRLVLSGTDTNGNPASVEYLLIKNQFWGRDGSGHGTWKSWQHLPGYDADILIPYYGVLCPWSVALEGLHLPMKWIKKYVRYVGADTVGGLAAWHLRTQEGGSRLDEYVDQHTFRWLRIKTVNKTRRYGTTTYDTAYSRFNVPLQLQTPGK